MGGASLEHNRITRNLSGVFYNLFKNDVNYESFHNDLRVYDAVSSSCCYPDIVVVEDEPLFVDTQFDTLANPVFIAEVLSPATEARDKIEKFEIYKSIPSLKEYMLVAQDRAFVRLYKKIAPNHWEFFEFNLSDEPIPVIENKFSISLKDIYKKIF